MKKIKIGDMFILNNSKNFFDKHLIIIKKIEGTYIWFTGPKIRPSGTSHGLWYISSEQYSIGNGLIRVNSCNNIAKLIV